MSVITEASPRHTTSPHHVEDVAWTLAMLTDHGPAFANSYTELMDALIPNYQWLDAKAARKARLTYQTDLLVRDARAGSIDISDDQSFLCSLNELGLVHLIAWVQ